MNFYTNIQMIGNQFLVRGYEDGKRVHYRDTNYRPTLYVNSKVPTKYKTLEGEYVEAIQPGTVRDCRDFYKKYDEIENFKIYGNERYIYQYISDKYPQDEIKFDIKKMRLLTIDIEVSSEEGFPDPEHCSEEMLTISIQDYATKKITTWGRKPYTPSQDNVTYHYYPEEREMLGAFIDWWMNDYPDVVTGWNTRLYDIPYICGRIDRVLGERALRNLSPWGLATKRETWINGRMFYIYDIGGITDLDYLELYKKFTYVNRESYRLDFIAEVELGQKKLDHSEFDTFKEFYSGEFNVSLDEEVEPGSLRHKGKIRSLLRDKLQKNK